MALCLWGMKRAFGTMALLLTLFGSAHFWARSVNLRGLAAIESGTEVSSGEVRTLSAANWWTRFEIPVFWLAISVLGAGRAIRQRLNKRTPRERSTVHPR